MRLIGKSGNDLSLDYLTFALFFASFVHPAAYVLFELYLLAVGLCVSPVYVNSFKSLLVISMRGMMHSQIAVSTSVTSFIKWVVVIGLSLYVVVLFHFDRHEESKSCHRYWHIIALFCIYCSLSSFVFSSYPVVALFKVISYAIPFYAAYLCVNKTFLEFNWVRYIAKIAISISILSLTWRDAHHFNHGGIWSGFFQNPNGYAQVLTIAFTACLVVYTDSKRARWIILAGLMFLIDLFLAGSRTCLAAMLCVAIAWLIYFPVSANRKIVLIAGVSALSLMVLVLFFPLIHDIFISFFFKWGDDMGLLGSRIGQITGVLDRFQTNPLFGTGFNVPYVDGFVDYHMYLSLPVENGNFILAILADTGLVGFCLYMASAVYMFLHTQKKYLPLFFCPYLIAMGEMLLFSTNSLGLYTYGFFSLCLVAGGRKPKADSVFFKHGLIC